MARNEALKQDYIIQRVLEAYPCRVLWSEGRPCLEYSSQEELDSISRFVETQFQTELLEVFFAAVARLPEE